MKTKITKNSKIALLALILFSPVLFSPVGNNLQAQEQKSSKTTGWFVGINPFSPSIELETKHSESYTNFTRITETISGDIETRREVTVDSNITSTSAADLRVEYEIYILDFDEVSAPATIQDKIGSVEAAKIACSDDVDYNLFRIYKDFYFSLLSFSVHDSHSNQIYCGLPADATAIAEISNSLALGTTQSFNYTSDSFASGGITTSSDEQFTPTLVNGVSSGASSKTKLKGSNLHFGYAFENFRLTFSDFSWSSTSGNIRSSVLFADWLLPRGFYAGAGIAANSLKHNGASDKALKPVFTFGKKKKFSSRLSINLGVIYQQVELSTSNITSNNTISSNTETGLAEALAAAGTTTETTTTSSNEAVAQVRSWLEQHPDRDKDNLIIVYSSTPLPISTVKYTTEVVPYRLVYAPGTSTTTTKTTTTNNATVIERTTETGTMQEIQTESKVTIPPLFFINISINF